MIPVIAPHALQIRKQIVAFVGATPIMAKVGSNNQVSAGNIQFMLGRPDFLKPALVLMAAANLAAASIDGIKSTEEQLLRLFLTVTNRSVP